MSQCRELSKEVTHRVVVIICQILPDFQNFSTSILGNKFAIKCCEMLMLAFE